MNIPYVFKKCTKCGEILPATEKYFHKAKDGKYRLRAQCKKCRKKYRDTNKEARAEYDRQYKETHKEIIAEYHRQYYKDNKEARKEHDRQYYETNKEAIAERQRRYNQSPQGQVVAFNIASRRRAKEQAQGNGITKEQWLELMSFFDFRCAYSGEYLGGKDNQSIRTIDHIDPLNKGGINEIWNVVPAYKNYNISKHDKDMLEWYTEQEYFSQDRLNKIYEWQEYAFNKWGIDTEAQ